MSEILVVGLSHHATPLGVRERLSVATEATITEVQNLLERAPLTEGVLLSTCNRVELYAVAPDPGAAARAIREYLHSRAGGDDLSKYLYERWGEDAVRHAFRVAVTRAVAGSPCGCSSSF